MLLAAFFVASSLILLSNAAKCSVKNGDMSARWQVADDELTIEVTTNNIGNNEWSALGFGPDMSQLDVILFQIVNNKPTLKTGTTSGYGAPQLDSTSTVKLQSLNYNSNTLVARFSRPVGSLSGCTTWNFVEDGTIEDKEVGYHNSPPHSIEVCAKKCTRKIFD